MTFANLHRIKALAILVVTLLATATGITAVRAQMSVSMQTMERAEVHCQFDPQAGTIELGFRAPPLTQSELAKVQIAAIRIDGTEQTNFTPLDFASDDRIGATNNIVRVESMLISGGVEAIIWTTVDGKLHDFEIPVTDNSSYYGCGERFHAINQKGYIVPMASIDRTEQKGVACYKPIPFFMSTRNYGVWFDSAVPATIDFNVTDREHVWIHCRASRVRIVCFAGRNMADLLDGFTRLTGRPKVPPAWAFAPWKSRDVHRNREDVIADAELSRKHDLPCSVIVIDSPWETCYNNFELNEGQFKDPAAMFDRLRELGFYTCLWLTPFVNVQNRVDMHGITEVPCDTYLEAREKGYLVKRPDGEPMIAGWWKGRGALIDFTNPNAVKWWHTQLDKAKPWGFRSLKCDDGEGNFVKDAVFFDGTPAAEMRNRYTALYADAAQQYIDSRFEGDGVLWARSGFTGTQAQPCCWAGDNEANFSFQNGLPSVVLAGQTAALSGLPMWGHDIAGYLGRPTKELFIRWTQFGAFSPIMQVHMQSNLGPWDFDDETLAIYRRFARLHMSLFPYVFDAAHAAHDRGMPIMRPMVLAFQDDHEAHSKRYEYMFGPDLLVAPMVQPGTYRSVYLPKVPDNGARSSNGEINADWIDFWTGRRYGGGQTIEVHAPLDRMPLFVRAGAVICMLPDDVDTLIPRTADMADNVVAIDDRRILAVWPGSPPRNLTTYDGITVEKKTIATNADDKSSGPKHISSSKTTLTISSTSPRRIELRRMNVDVAALGDDWTLVAEGGFATKTIDIGPTPVEIMWAR